MKKISSLLCIIALATFGLGACEDSPDAAPALVEDTSKAVALAPSSSPQEATGDEATGDEGMDINTVIARVNGAPIYAYDLEKQLSMVEAGESVFKGSMSENKDNLENDDLILKRDILNGLIALELVIQEAINRGYAPTEAELTAEIKKNIENYNAAMGGKATMPKNTSAPIDDIDPNDKELREQVTKTLALKKWQKYELLSEIKVSVEEARALYDQNPSLSRHGDIVRARQIFIGVPLLAPVATRPKFKEKAEAVMQRLKNGESFVVVAREVSNDPDVGETGGDLGWMEKDSALPFFGQALQNMKPGEISEIVETPTGFYIYQMIDAKSKGVEPFEGIRPQLVEYLSSKKMPMAVANKTKQLYQQAEIEIYDPALKQAFEKLPIAKSPTENQTTEAK